MILENIVDYNLEYAHIYSNDLNGNLEKVKRNIDKTITVVESLKRMGCSIALSVLVDDYTETQTEVNTKEVYDIFTRLGLPPDHIVMESVLTKQANYFLENLPEKYLIKKDNKIIFQSESKDIHFSELLVKKKRYKAVFLEKSNVNTDLWKRNQQKEILSLKQQRIHSNSELILYVDNGLNIRFSCPLLAACWYLARLGTEPFYSSLSTFLISNKPFIGRSLITILPIEFLKVESTAVELIGLSKTKKISKCKKKIEYYFLS